MRTDLKPLNVVQPEGASFKVTKVGETGEIIEWQKWSFRVGYNQREGPVLYDVSLPPLTDQNKAQYCRSDMMAGVYSTAWPFLT